MLTELHIRNFAIIDDLRLDFEPGLNILTGETGAGKSIIIDAVGLLLGDRAGVEVVRAGSESALIEARFGLPPSAQGGAAPLGAEEVEEGPPPLRDLRSLLESEGLDDPDSPDEVTLAREVRVGGRTLCRINGRAVNLQRLAEVAAALVDIHGQGEHLNLLRPRTHVDLLDRYAGLLPLRAEVAAEVAALRQVRRDLLRLRQDARTVAQRVDLLSFQVEEITAARLRPGEEAELEGERRRLANAETLLKLAQAAAAFLEGGEGGGDDAPAAVDLVSEAVGRLEKLARIDPDLLPHAVEGQALLEQLADLARLLADYAERLEFNPVRLQEVEERLELFAVLKRKYGDTLEQVVAWGRRAAQELESLANWEVRTADFEAREEQLLHSVGVRAARLSAERRAAGAHLARAVEQELTDLQMARARFDVDLRQSERADGVYLPDGRRMACDASGIDQVEFLISANPGEPLRPMAKVASGGETARLMLALKGTLAHADATPTLIFDEIDQGIGGRVGAVVGEKLWRLTGNAPAPAEEGVAGAASADAAHQVLCITHLPQLAAYGDAHFTVNKRVVQVGGEERTTTEVRRLERDERVTELAQMLGAPNEAGRSSVEGMLRAVAEVKQAAQARESRAA